MPHGPRARSSAHHPIIDTPTPARVTDVGDDLPPRRLCVAASVSGPHRWHRGPVSPRTRRTRSASSWSTVGRRLSVARDTAAGETPTRLATSLILAWALSRQWAHDFSTVNRVVPYRSPVTYRLRAEPARPPSRSNGRETEASSWTSFPRPFESAAQPMSLQQECCLVGSRSSGVCPRIATGRRGDPACCAEGRRASGYALAESVFMPSVS